MKLFFDKDQGLVIIPETTQDYKDIEEGLGLLEGGDWITLVRQDIRGDDGLSHLQASANGFYENTPKSLSVTQEIFENGTEREVYPLDDGTDNQRNKKLKDEVGRTPRPPRPPRSAGKVIRAALKQKLKK